MSMFDSAKVLYKLVDPTIATDTRTDTPSSESDYSDTDNLDIIVNKKKGAYLEKDYFVLDGTHTFLETGDDVGWESENLSNDTGATSGELIELSGTVETSIAAVSEVKGNTTGGGGTPSTPIAIVSPTSPIGLTVCGKNLFDIGGLINNDVAEKYNNGLKLTKTAAGRFSERIPMSVPAGTYWISYDIIDKTTAGSIGQRAFYIDDSEYYIPASGRCNFTKDVKSVDFYAQGTDAEETGFTIDNIQIEKGSTATDYEPYNGTDYSIPLKDISDNFLSLARLSSTVYDRVYKNLTDGKWYSEKKTKTIVFDGSVDESWNTELIGGTARNFYIAVSDSIGNGRINPSLCSHAIYSLVLSADGTQRFGATTNWNFLTGSLVAVNTVSEFKTWLSSNHVTLLYQLVTPVTVELHADTVAVLEAIYLKTGTTNLFGINTVVPNLSVLDIYEWLNFSFTTTHDSYGITINFPTTSYPKDFLIVYSGSGSVIHTTTVTDNTTTNYRDNTDVFGWDNIRIVITALNNRGQRARIWSVVFGTNEEWNGDDIIKITASKCTDLTAEKVESGEVEFDVYNDGGVFDIQDIKDLSPEVQRNIIIEVSFRRGGVYTKFGTYKSSSTQVADKGRLITISGYDEFNRIGQSFFEKGKIPSAPKSLGAWSEEVSADCGLELEIDASLYDIYSNGYIGYVPHREALRLIAEAGNCILVVDSDGKNYIKPHVPSAYGAITDDNLIADSGEISNADKLDGVVVERYTYALSSTSSGLAEIQGIALTGSPQTIWIDYATYPADVSSVASSANIIIDNGASVWYSDRAKIVFTGTATETGWITILGYAYNTATTSYTEGSNGNVKTISNSLITEDSVATAVLAYQWSRAENIYKYTAEVYVDSDGNLGDSATYEDNTIYITKITRSIDSDEASETVEGVDA